MGDSGEFNIEIDAESGDIVLIKPDGTSYFYTVEELEGKGILDRLIGAGSEVTVYSQKESFTLGEYIQLFGSE